MCPEDELQELLERSQKSQDELRELIQEAKQISAAWNELDWRYVWP